MPMAITDGVLWLPGFLDTKVRPPSRRKGFTIYTDCVCFDKAAESSFI